MRIKCANSECEALRDLSEKCPCCYKCQLCGFEKSDQQEDDEDHCECEECKVCSNPVRHPDRSVRLECTNCKCCSDCCGCSKCATCHDKVNGTCELCSCCSSCCECVECTSCGARSPNSDDFCWNCDYCTECCDCDCEKDDFIKAKNVWHGKSGRYLGVEIEVDEGSKKNISQVVSKWGAGLVKDGSLSCEGFEVTTAPARGDAFLKQIKEMCEALKEDEAKTTRACGLHVHVDARDLKFYEIRKVLSYYAAIEPALYAILPEWRRSSRYCLPTGMRFINLQISKHKQLRQKIHEACYESIDRDIADRKKHKYDDARYYGLNLHSWFFRGTIEFRHFGGSTQFEKITCWARLCSAIVEYAAFAKDAEIDDMNYSEPIKNLEKAMKLAGQDVYEWVQHRWITMYNDDIEEVKKINSMKDVGVY